MSRYRTLLEQYDKLKFEIEREMRAESERLEILVAARIREVLEEFGLAIDVMPRARQLPLRRERRHVAPKYWNPKTGQTWSGRGRTPSWIEGVDREQYRIEAVADKSASRYATGSADERVDATSNRSVPERAESGIPASHGSSAGPDTGGGAYKSGPLKMKPIQLKNDD
ncbi:H-NS family nucleoid-associated regulatory protein [Burkholderia cepacia]|uniref:H-NS histone family protein n=1 Tax=Burkholderia cepacia TaxID=292 RepID=UPI00158EFA48|nr:H-NS histone family protein [Burkholderia cepacia]